MKIITKNGWFAPANVMIHRLEPWTTPQEIDDDYLPVLPSKMIIVVPPAGFKFARGVSPDDHPTKADLVPDDYEDDGDTDEEHDAEDGEISPEDATEPNDPMAVLQRLKDKQAAATS